MTPVILGLAGPSLSADERAFLADVRPAGFILFARNVDAPTQLRALTDSLRDAVAREDVAILIDQEGGAVARLRPPEWPDFPAVSVFDALYEIAPMTAIEAMRANGEALGVVLRTAGITVNCAPVLDLRHDATSDAIAGRCLGRDPLRVAALGRAMLDGMARGGVAGVIKHMPGQGRARTDSHVGLPVVTGDADVLATDFAPFRALAGAAIGMTAHVLYPDIDPRAPATLSHTVIADVVRVRIGFDGLLLSDDIGMGALTGPVPARATAALAAGVDCVLECSGDLATMRAVAEAVPPITGAARTRLDRALALPVEETDAAAAIARRDALLAVA